AQANGADDRLRRIGMGRDIGAATARFVDDRGDLLLGELQHPDRIARRSDPARHEDLEMMSPLAQCLARGLAHRIDPVDPPGEDTPPAASAELLRFMRCADVAVPAALAEGMAAIEQARADHPALLDRPPQAVIAT